MSDLAITTRPKPFIFILMPFEPAFNDVYKFGIKGAAEAAGAYAERVDEQIFVEGMLDRIFNQINKADVIVADMTGKNPNVFYEVGYAHALDKIVLLITQNAEDIPFDLKHRQHIVYGGSIEKLKEDLTARITWAVAEAARREEGLSSEGVSVRLNGVDLLRNGSIESAPYLTGSVSGDAFHLGIIVRNESAEDLYAISHVYLFAASDAAAVPAEMRESPLLSFEPYDFRSSLAAFGPQNPSSTSAPVEIESFTAAAIDGRDGLSKQYRLPLRFGQIPPGAIESGKIVFLLRGARAVGTFRLRVHSANAFDDFYFNLDIQKVAPPPTPVRRSA